MRTIILGALLVVFLAVSADEILDREWEFYKNTQARNYTAQEDIIRKKLFAENFYRIVEHNKLYEAGKETYRKIYNNFTDWTSKEVQEYLYLNHKPAEE